MLAIYEGVGRGAELLAVCCLVVLVSVVLHGFSPTLIPQEREQSPAQKPPSSPLVVLPDRPPTQPAVVAPVAAVPAGSEFISLAEVGQLREKCVPVVLLDARTERTYNPSDLVAEGALRLHPNVQSRRRSALVSPSSQSSPIFCACQNEATSARVALELRKAGWKNARALVGGWGAIEKAGLPVAPKH